MRGLIITLCVASHGALATRPHLDTPGRALVVIGANDATSNDNEVVLSWLRFCADNSAAAEAAGLKVLLVEPNPGVYASLERTVSKTYRSAASIVPVNMLVGTNSTAAGTAPFHMVNSTLLLEDCPNAPHWVLHQLSSLSTAHVKHGLQGFISCVQRSNPDRPRPSCDGSQCNLPAMQRRTTTSYLFHRTVPIATFAQLLQKNGLEPADVDVLAIDAQGHDAAILQHAFAESPDLFPRVVIFEHAMLSHTVKNATIELLESRGFATDCPIRNGLATCRMKSRQDVYATQTRRGLYMGVPIPGKALRTLAGGHSVPQPV